MLIEVADSSLAYDRSTKLRLCAEAGIPEYWVVDCAAEAVEVYSSQRDRRRARNGSVPSRCARLGPLSSVPKFMATG